MDQNFDTYSVEYTYPDGTKLYFDGRCMNNTKGIFSSYLHGTKGSAICSRANDCGGPSATFKSHNMTPENLTWEATDNTNPYQNEWDVLIERIRNNKPHNEVQYGIEASLTCNMGRMAAHTGQEVTWDAILNSDHEFGLNVDKLTKESPSPLMPEASGKYPVPMPGLKQMREY